ncbi:hypothetical protein SLNWT_3209 [Streptomyces albus]|uniref:Uncharacterized protein n=1 Tax=Streptomyces albus (strain ATCC 21838 / DSM 41398 / FERM P-419 / JCM 4703 / NBRC 107858) TaxID=1081613 RepID=A0A0B5EWI6_STRA4|nr:hypothetical protein SLNWT_3209 [Streptomyces albus]AOU77893.1 hypothetical protein SLNHY_3202 [Streptomyces albus]
MQRAAVRLPTIPASPCKDHMTVLFHRGIELRDFTLHDEPHHQVGREK